MQEISDDADFPAWVGGDEFAMIISGVSSEAEILMIANGIRTRILAPIEFDDHVFQIGVSIGVVQLNQHAKETPEDLFTCSDIAPDEAKRTDRSVVILTAFGCHVVQGVLFSRPTDASKMSKWLRAWQDITRSTDRKEKKITA